MLASQGLIMTACWVVLASYRSRNWGSAAAYWGAHTSIIEKLRAAIEVQSTAAERFGLTPWIGDRTEVVTARLRDGNKLTERRLAWRARGCGDIGCEIDALYVTGVRHLPHQTWVAKEAVDLITVGRDQHRDFLPVLK